MVNILTKKFSKNNYEGHQFRWQMIKKWLAFFSRLNIDMTKNSRRYFWDVAKQEN